VTLKETTPVTQKHKRNKKINNILLKNNKLVNNLSCNNCDFKCSNVVSRDNNCAWMKFPYVINIFFKNHFFINEPPLFSWDL
jgi:hypothetical protein